MFTIIDTLFSGYESVALYHNGVQVQSSDTCVVRQLHRINMTDYPDQGVYTCLAQTADGSNVTEPVGNLKIVGKCVTIDLTDTTIKYYRDVILSLRY